MFKEQKKEKMPAEEIKGYYLEKSREIKELWEMEEKRLPGRNRVGFKGHQI